MNKNIKNKEIIVQFSNVTKKFGNFTAVSDITFEIFRGEILGFLGPNGAGKSTTMKMLANLISPNEGVINIRGNGDSYLQQLSSQTKDYLLDNIGFLIENPIFYDNMTPRQTLTYFAKLKGYPTNKINDRVEYVVSLVGMSDWIDNKLGTFSKGMRQKIGIISAMVHDPDIIILDEPQTGLDPKARIEIRNLILRLKDIGKTIFISSHLLYEVSEVADRIAIINHGEIIACDTLDNLEDLSKKSLIHVEINNFNEPEQIIEKIKTAIKGMNLSSGKISINSVEYNIENNDFTILFDGNSNTQHSLLKALIDENLEIIEYSVPKVGLLENLYLEFIDTSDYVNNNGVTV